MGITLVAVRGDALDKKSKAYADSAIPAIVSTWSEKELLDRASPEFKKVVMIDDLDRTFRWYSSTLGQLRKCDPAQGESIMSETTPTRKMILYTARANFQKGEATIQLVLVKHGDQWQILSFNVDSEALD